MTSGSDFPRPEGVPGLSPGDTSVFEAFHTGTGGGVPLPPLPQIGYSEARYAHRARRAEREGNHHDHEANKCAQYITLALARDLSWPQKLKYFRHALARHCVPPAYPDEATWMFYRSLADIVRQYAGREALRLASKQDDRYAARLRLGIAREAVSDEAERFFAELMPGEHCPDWFNEDDYAQLRILRDQWV